MKVIIHFSHPENSELNKTLKITLPKSWKNGPTSRLLQQFIESYNVSNPDNPLSEDKMHLEVRDKSHDSSNYGVVPLKRMKELASDEIVLDCIDDRADIYVDYGPSRTKEELNQLHKAEKERLQRERSNMVACTHYGCRNRFPKGGPYPECHHHVAPPIFHETAKYWSCCPNKKAYDWEEFQSIPGCEVGVCSEVKEDGQKDFLGGCDVRERLNGGGPKLKSIDDFNMAAVGGSEAAPILDRLRSVLAEMNVENELFDQVVDGIKVEISGKHGEGDTVKKDDHLQEVVMTLGKKFKDALKAIAVKQQKIP